ncbi:MAG: EamA family transporter [Lachnospiraceae bacterium]|nr:EamA family transporter [Lachnospiraceae bacterium]
MWILFAFASAFFAGLTSILAKCGIKKTDSTVATAVRTIIVLTFSWLMVLIVGSFSQLKSIDDHTLIFLILSGLSTGASWLCYFKALQLGDINKVVPIDKSSTVLTIVLAFLFLQEKISLPKTAGVILIAAGTYLMIEKRASVSGNSMSNSSQKPRRKQRGIKFETLQGAGYLTLAAVAKCLQAVTWLVARGNNMGWLFYALGSAIFASLTAILGKVGITDVESNLGTAIRTCVVLIMAWIMVFVTGKPKKIREIPGRELGFICLSGLATGASWLCYYKALQDGPASVVVPIDKLSILVTVAFSYLVFHEKLNRKSALGLIMITVGTLAMLIK